MVTLCDFFVFHKAMIMLVEIESLLSYTYAMTTKIIAFIYKYLCPHVFLHMVYWYLHDTGISNLLHAIICKQNDDI